MRQANETHELRKILLRLLGSPRSRAAVWGEGSLGMGDLDRWLARIGNRYDRLPIDGLEELWRSGFPFPVPEKRWLENFFAYRRSRPEEPLTGKPRPGAPKALLSWAKKQRELREEMPLVRVALFNRIGFCWNRYEGKWHRNYEKLEEFFHKNGHCRVPDDWKEDPALGDWCATQRIGRAGLTPRRRMLLEKIKFVWAPRASRWGQLHEDLVRFHGKHGHCNVPLADGEFPQLGAWVVKQRQLRRMGRLSSARQEMLISLGFEWQRKGVHWDSRLEKLRAYRRRYRHCRVTARQDPELAQWCSYVRTLIRRGKLSADKMAVLKKLGFEAGPVSNSWERHWKELKAYGHRHGNVHVPFRYRENPSLGVWVCAQRRARKNGSLSRERQRRLEQLGFSWESVNRRSSKKSTSRR